MQPPGTNRLATTTSQAAVGRFDEPIDAARVVSVVGRINHDIRGRALLEPGHHGGMRAQSTGS